jgi:hypothetical protein
MNYSALVAAGLAIAAYYWLSHGNYVYGGIAAGGLILFIVLT